MSLSKSRKRRLRRQKLKRLRKQNTNSNDYQEEKFTKPEKEIKQYHKTSQISKYYILLSGYIRENKVDTKFIINDIIKIIHFYSMHTGFYIKRDKLNNRDISDICYATDIDGNRYGPKIEQILTSYYPFYIDLHFENLCRFHSNHISWDNENISENKDVYNVFKRIAAAYNVSMYVLLDQFIKSTIGNILSNECNIHFSIIHKEIYNNIRYNKDQINHMIFIMTLLHIPFCIENISDLDKCCLHDDVGKNFWKQCKTYQYLNEEFKNEKNDLIKRCHQCPLTLLDLCYKASKYFNGENMKIKYEEKKIISVNDGYLLCCQVWESIIFGDYWYSDTELSLMVTHIKALCSETVTETSLIENKNYLDNFCLYTKKGLKIWEEFNVYKYFKTQQDFMENKDEIMRYMYECPLSFLKICYNAQQYWEINGEKNEFD